MIVSTPVRYSHDPDFSISPAGSGNLVSIERIIDREQDAYRETVKNEQGKISVEKHERLPEHH